MYRSQFDQIHVMLTEAFVMPKQCPQPTSMMVTLVLVYTDILNCSGIKVWMKHPQNGLNKENCSRTHCKESYCQPDLKMPHHLCEIICMWIDRLHDKVTWVMLMGTGNPTQIRAYYTGMTAEVCCTALSRRPMTAPIPIPIYLNKRTNNLEVNLPEQSLKECNSSLLLTVNSHHEH